ncbi:MAG: hypothetical protein ACR2LI_12860 [Propionibacteriaceae bacterium]
MGVSVDGRLTAGPEDAGPDGDGQLDVLPHPDDAGKDLGVFNLATALPQTVSPDVVPLARDR